MKNWKFVKTGNDSLITKDGRVNYPDKEIGEINILKRELEGLMRMAQSDKTHDYTKQIEALKKEISEKKNKYAVGNESIEKQEWSMFKGLSKDAEKEVGNSTKATDSDGRTWEFDVKKERDSDGEYFIADIRRNGTSIGKSQVNRSEKDMKDWIEWKIKSEGLKKVGNADIPTEQDLKNWIRMSQQDMKDAQREMEKNKPLGHPDSYREENYGRAKVKYDEAAKAIKKMEEELRQGKYKKVGNAYTPNPELIKVLEAWLHNRMSEQEARAKIMKITGDKNITDMMIHSPGGFIPAGNKKTGNESIGDEYNAEIYRLEKKKMDLERMGQGQKAREIEKQIQQLQKELREYDIGNNKVGNTGHWDSKKMIYSKWDDEKGRPSDEYARITWLGEGKGGLAVVWRGTSMTGVKYGSNNLEDLRRWAEEKIGNAAVDAEVVAREVVEGKEYIVEKTSLRNGHDVQFNLYYSMDGSGKRHAGVFKDKDSAVSAGKKIVGNARPKEQLLADVRELTKYIQEHNGQGCEKEKRLLGEAKEELDKNYGVLVNNLKRARNAMTNNSQITLWNGNDSVLISENGLVQYLENNSFETDRDKYDSQEKAVEELTKKGYHKK